MLDELTRHADRVDKGKIESLIVTLFSIADEIDVEADGGRGFSGANNRLRLHWFLRALTNERLTPLERSSILVQASRTATLAWLADFCQSAWFEHYPKEGRQPVPEERCLVTREDAQELRKVFLKRIEHEVLSGTLIETKRLAYVLFRWRDLSDDSGSALRTWANGQLAFDRSVIAFASAFTGDSWSQGLGTGALSDVVAKKATIANVGGLDSLMDASLFRARVEEMATTDRNAAVVEFLAAWRRNDQAEES